MTAVETSDRPPLESLELAEPTHLAEHPGRMDVHVYALRSSKTANEGRVEEHHCEQAKCRDKVLRDPLPQPFIYDLVILFDDLSGLLAQIETAGEASGGKRGALGQWRDNLENAIHSLTEILHRMEVSEIEQKEKVDRALHRVVSFEPADFPEEDGQIVMRVKRGFLWRDQVLRPEEVVAKRFG